MPSVAKKPPFSEITLKNGEKYKVVETFSTVLRHQKLALEDESAEPVISLMGPEGTRVAVDPIEIVSVTELKRPTRNYGKGRKNGKVEKPKAKPKTAAAKRLAQRRKPAEQKTAARRRARATA